MVLSAVSFSSRPVVRLAVSVTFTPEALPIGFNSSVDVNLCFEISSETTAATSGNRQPSWPTQCWGHSLLASGQGKRMGWVGLCGDEVLGFEIPLFGA